MAAQSPEEDYSLFLSENGHLSFENPNYQLDPLTIIDPARLDDHLNSNIEPSIPVNVYQELQQELNNRDFRGNMSTRRVYASMDVSAMGVDVDAGPVVKKLDNKLIEDTEVESAKLQVEEIPEKPDKTSPEVVKRRPKKALPAGWEKHEDDQGPYFWHVKSGTIQREPPEAGPTEMNEVIRDVRSSKIFEEDFAPPPIMPKSCTSSSIADLKEQSSEMSTSITSTGSSKNEWKRRSLPPASSSTEAKSMQVSVRSLGWIELSETDLTPDNSSKAVNRCIVQLSNGPKGLEDPVGQWGGGKDLILELDDGTLKLIDPFSGAVLNTQPIHTIRVWGVGRDNARDFAYVARDKQTRKHMCHVFRCDVPARAIANALRDICKKILIERSLAQSSSKLIKAVGGTAEAKRAPAQQRPTSLGVGNAKLQTRTVPAPDSFPTPMEEPRKVVKAWFLGTKQVARPCGIEVIHEVIDDLVGNVPRSEWKTVTVAVAPSTVTVSFHEEKSANLDCRVRFLSFLGIGKNVQQCAYIMHTAQDTFVCHAFHCEPTAGPLCKTIEAACKLRYQKCLDARPQSSFKEGPPPPAKSIGTTIKNMFGTTFKRLSSSSHEES